MKINYTYNKTKKIKKLLQKLEVLKQVVELLPNLPHIEKNLRREAFLRSSLFSARIEGNKLNFEDIKNLGKTKPKILTKIEVFNIFQAANWLFSKKIPKRLSLKLILKFHSFALNGISSQAGKLRREPSAIFNQAGVAVYVTPPANEIKKLLLQLIKSVNRSKDPVPVNSVICHFAFEKIHPFIDGNGRVGRLLSSFILIKSGYEYKGFTSLEEYLEKNRQAYYDFLQVNKKDITKFIEFYLEALVIQTEKGINKFKTNKVELPQDQLLPRRREILEIIKDHKTVSFDFISRRFLVIPESTLHYDLRQLMKKGFIKKLGATKGVVYEKK